MSAFCLKRFLDYFVVQPPLKNVSAQSTFFFLQLNYSKTKYMYKIHVINRQ